MLDTFIGLPAEEEINQRIVRPRANVRLLLSCSSEIVFLLSF
jgi:hypothetical protein